MKKIYYKNESEKGFNNFKISGQTVSLDLFYSVAIVKKASAIANNKIGRLNDKIFQAIKKSIDRILNKEFDDQFIIDQIQGGAGTSINMNVNEVISSIAEEILNDGTKVHPNDDVNMGQSTNDVIPTAIKLIAIKKFDELILVCKNIATTLRKKEKDFSNIIKVGRTHLQDAVPMTLGQTFGAYASFIERNITRFEETKKYLLSTNLGGTAIGSGINSSKSYIKIANEELAKISGYNFFPAKDLFDLTQNSDDFAHFASVLKTFAMGLSKISTDIRMLASGPRAGISEIFLPELQKGSSIMPGKVNPVVLEMMNQICYQVYGNAETCFNACENSQFELNVMLPIYAKNILEALTILTNGIKTLDEKVISGIAPNLNKIKSNFENSLCLATALNRYIGYDKASELVKRAERNGTNLIDELRNENLINEEKLKKILNPKNLTEPQDEFEKI
ncbi:MAG: aspartate ammonia-lyase [Patescibacteria group bacterium]